MNTRINRTQTVIFALVCFASLVFIATPFALGQSPASQGTSGFQSVDVRNESLQVDIKMKAGILELGTHQAGKAEMAFDYSRNSWKPEVQMRSKGGSGFLSIEQPGEGSNSFSMDDDEQNTWKLKLPQAVPMDLEISLGAGESTLDLRGAKLNSLEMKAGAGDFDINLANTSVSELEISAGVGSLTLDLTGKRTTNLEASINGGIGDLKLLLPQEIGVRVKVNGLGGLDTEGFKKEGGYYVNEAYGKTSSSLEITVNGGLGNCTLAMETSTR